MLMRSRDNHNEYEENVGSLAEAAWRTFFAIVCTGLVGVKEGCLQCSDLINRNKVCAEERHSGVYTSQR